MTDNCWSSPLCLFFGKYFIFAVRFCGFGLFDIIEGEKQNRCLVTAYVILQSAKDI